MAAIGIAVFVWLRLGGGSGDGPAAERPVPTLSAGTPAASRPGTAPAPGRRPGEPRREAVEAALTDGVVAAAKLGGTVEAAVLADGWATPIVVTSERDGAGRHMRMWSMSKVTTMIALLRARGWGERPGRPISPELGEALSGALRRSENCRQRLVVLALENAAGGTEAARVALAGVFAASGAEAEVGSETEAADEVCAPYLEGQKAVEDPMRPALLLGTSTWRVGDAVRLMRALATERFGAAVSKRVLALLRAPKLVSREVPPGELTAPLQWGAGHALEGLEPAYKAGWGGTMHGNFLAGQVALVALPHGGHLSMATMFHPDVQPSRDDPGITAAPQAIKTVFGSLRAFAE